MAIAPTATIANIAGCFPSVEPIYKNIYVKSNFSGEFTIINRYLVDDLKKLGLWTEEMSEKLKYYDGSVQNIAEVPDELKLKYKEVFEIDPRCLVDHASLRAKWIDQSQSINIFMTTTSGKAISDVYQYAWQRGLKTTYYMRTLGASAIEKSTLDHSKKYESELDRAPANADSNNENSDIPAAMVSSGACLVNDPTCEACQ
jgi:ribonucleoside-diphosphate reductase alpha chain